MATITLKHDWTYRTVETTIDFRPGTHEVSDEIAAALDLFLNPPPPEPEEPTAEETDNGRSNPAPRAPRSARKAEGA